MHVPHCSLIQNGILKKFYTNFITGFSVCFRLIGFLYRFLFARVALFGERDRDIMVVDKRCLETYNVLAAWHIFAPGTTIVLPAFCMIVCAMATD